MHKEVETTNLAGGAGKPTVESPRIRARTIKGKKHFITKSTRVKTIMR